MSDIESLRKAIAEYKESVEKLLSKVREARQNVDVNRKSQAELSYPKR